MDRIAIIPHVLAIAAAYALALPIGWDREKHARSAGLRTFPLVAMATCAFIQAAETFAAGSPEAMARIVEGVIVGMGFIGGGAILKKDGEVTGTATAASLWATGAVGMSAGLGAFDVAVTVSLATFLTLKLLPLLKDDKSQE